MKGFVSVVVGITLCVCFLCDEAPAGSGICYSAEELRQIKETLRGSLAPGQYGVLSWCVPRDKRNSICYSADIYNEPQGSDSAEIKRLKQNNVANMNMVHKAMADVYGGCLKAPVRETVRPLK